MLDLTGGSGLSGLTKVKDSVLFDSLPSSECARRMPEGRRNSIKTLVIFGKKNNKQWLLWTYKHKDFFVVVLI